MFEIPDKVTGTWIKTNPKKHKEQATAKNKEIDGYWVPLVKMVKGLEPGQRQADQTVVPD